MVTVAFDIVEQNQFEAGLLPHDLRHVIKVAASYGLPFGIVLGARIDYRTGEPYNRYGYDDWFGGYYNRYAPRGEDWDPDTLEATGTQLRLPSRLVTAARIALDLEELTGQRINASVDVFNVLNADTVTEVEERDMSDGSFGTARARLQPLRVQLGLRYRY